jgi:ESF2/ABP1 family protein
VSFSTKVIRSQPAYERNVHQSRLRAEITRAKAEQNSYLKNVELARVLNKREEKRAAQPAAEGKAADDSKASKGKRNYRQREVADRAHGLEATGMENVLGNIFG